MSMISDQVDRLRTAAQTYRRLGNHSAESMLLDAADTIWELRDDLQRANAENASLREQLAKARDPQRIGGTADPESFVYAIEQLREFRWQHATNDEEAISYINNVADAHERENAKLLELVTRMASALGIYSEWVDANWCKSSCRLEFECFPEDMDIRCPAWAAMRELGVEVDG